MFAKMVEAMEVIKFSAALGYEANPEVLEKST